jgi:hypothetical protein
MPLDIPMAPTVGHITTPEFTVNVEENFLIQLDVDREVPEAIMDEVLGIGNLLSSKPSEAHGFKVAWALSSDAKIVRQDVSDEYKHGYWGSTTGRLLGYFHAQKGGRYRLDVDVLEDGSRLAPYHPHLKVTVDLFTLDGYAMGEGFSELAGLLIAGIGAVLVASAIAVRGRAAKRKA